MRSFYISYLLLNRDSIKNVSTPVDVLYISDYPEDFYDNGLQGVSINLDDDVYNDLLAVEQKLDQLYKLGVVSDLELNIINSLGGSNIAFSDESLYEIRKKFNLSRPWIIKSFNRVCELLEITLGGNFTNDGFIDYMMYKYDLSTNDINKLIKVVFN